MEKKYNKELNPVLVFHIGLAEVDVNDYQETLKNADEWVENRFKNSGYYTVIIPDPKTNINSVECLNPRHILDDGQKTTTETLSEFTKTLAEYNILKILGRGENCAEDN